jgi:hypothetical protein
MRFHTMIQAGSPAEVLDGDVGLNKDIAQNLVDARAKAPFTRVADIGKVKDVGPATMARMLYYTILEPEAEWHSWEDEYGHFWVDPLRAALEQAFPSGTSVPSGQEIWLKLLKSGALEALPGVADQVSYHPDKLDRAFKPPDNLDPALKPRIKRCLTSPAAPSSARPFPATMRPRSCARAGCGSTLPTAPGRQWRILRRHPNSKQFPSA